MIQKKLDEKMMFQNKLTLAPYTQEISRDAHMVTLELNGVKTVKSLAANASLPSPVEALQQLKVDVPKNVAIDSATWMAKADKFLVYDNVALLEINAKSSSLRKDFIEDEEYKNYTLDDQHPNFLLMSQGDELFEILEENELIPERIWHKANGSTFDKIGCAIKSAKSLKPLDKIRLKETSFIALQTENATFLSRLVSAFKEVGIEPIFPSGKQEICLVPSEARSKVQSTLKKLSKEFLVEIS